jgi:hypothetical protein
MLRCTILLLLALALPLDSPRAEIVSSWRAGFAAGDDLSSSGVLASWSTSFGGFVEARRQLTPNLEIAPRLTARVAWYDTYRGGFDGLPTVNVRWSPGRGSDLRAIEGRVAVRATGSGSARPFLGLAGGVLVADVPGVTLTGTSMFDPSELIVTAPGTDQVVTKALLGMSAGVLFRSARGSVDAGFEGSLIHSTDNRISRFEIAYFLGFR